MDKKILNNEIILCRSAIRKAKVAVVRKILKEMKILKGCKVEGLKEKKHKKAERLFKVVQAIKKLKDDEVTKFALRHKDFSEMLAKRNLKVRKKGLIRLAKHKAVEAKVNAIRQKIPDWENTLPILLESLGKKKKKVMTKNEKVNDKSDKSEKSEENELTEKSEENELSEKTEKNKVSLKKPAVKPKTKLVSESKVKDNVRESKLKEEIPVEEKKVEKIDDPFFIEKKVLVPKLLLESAPERNLEKKVRDVRPKWEERNNRKSKPFKGKINRIRTEREKPGFEPVQVEEKLHPSWAAKKVKLIKPFQGKKIKFSED